MLVLLVFSLPKSSANFIPSLHELRKFFACFLCYIIFLSLSSSYAWLIGEIYRGNLLDSTTIAVAGVVAVDDGTGGMMAGVASKGMCSFGRK